MIPYPGCSTSVPIWNEDMTFEGGHFRPSSAEHNTADVCVQATPPPPAPPKPPGWAAIPLPSRAQLAWSRHEVTAIGHYLPLCGHGDMQNASAWQSRGCSAPFAQDCLPAKEFNPKAVDTDGWVQAVAAMGAKGERVGHQAAFRFQPRRTVPSLLLWLFLVYPGLFACSSVCFHLL